MCVIPSFVVCRVALFRKLQSSVKMTIILRRDIISYILYSHGWFWFLLWLIPSFIWFNVNNIPRVFVFTPIVYMYHTLFLLWWRSLVFVNITKCQISYGKCNYDTEYQPSGWFRIGHDIGNYSSPSSTEHQVVCVLKDGEHAFNTDITVTSHEHLCISSNRNPDCFSNSVFRLTSKKTSELWQPCDNPSVNDTTVINIGSFPSIMDILIDIVTEKHRNYGHASGVLCQKQVLRVGTSSY